MKNKLIAYLLKQFAGQTLKFRIDSDDDDKPSIEGKVEIGKDYVANIILNLNELLDEIKNAGRK